MIKKSWTRNHQKSQFVNSSSFSSSASRNRIIWSSASLQNISRDFDWVISSARIPDPGVHTIHEKQCELQVMKLRMNGMLLVQVIFLSEALFSSSALHTVFHDFRKVGMTTVMFVALWWRQFLDIDKRIMIQSLPMFETFSSYWWLIDCK